MSGVAKALKESDVILTSEDWDKMNNIATENQERFEKESMELTPKTPEQSISELSKEVEELKEL